MTELQAIAIPFFTKEGWDDARKYMEDRAGFRASHAEFMDRLEQLENDMRKRGHAVVRVPIHREEFIRWCMDNNSKVDANARAQFASWKVLKGYGN